MRKTLKRNLAYDDRNHLFYGSLYYDDGTGRRVRRTRTYTTMEQVDFAADCIARHYEMLKRYERR